MIKLEAESEGSRRPSLLANVMGCFGGSASKNDAEEDKRRKEANKRIEKQIQKDKQVYRATHRLLLLGKHPTKQLGALEGLILSLFFLVVSPLQAPVNRARVPLSSK